MKLSKRIYYLDVLRVIACLAVIMIHTSGVYVTQEIGSLNFWIGNICDAVSRIGVPLFVMISGALMLDENYMFSKRKMESHIKKMIVFFVFWSVIYCIIFEIAYPLVVRHEVINIAKVIGTLIRGHYHLWYVYLIVGLYFIVPLLKLWVKGENKKYVEYFIVLSLVFTYLIPQFITIGGFYSDLFKYLKDILENNLCIKYVGGYTTYFILGWYINNYSIDKYKKIICIGLIGLIISIVGTYVVSVSRGIPTQMYGNFELNVFFQSIASFLFIKKKFENVENDESEVIKFIANNSLGIYAMHPLIISVLFELLEKMKVNSAIITIPVIFVVSLGVSLIGAFLFGRNRVLKKFV